MIVAWGTVAAGPPGSAARLAAFPLLWIATEHARTVVYKGFPWNLTGHALYRHAVWLQTASIWGVYGVGALVVVSAALLARAAETRRWRPALAAAALVAGTGAFGVARLGAAVPERPDVSVALLQPNLDEASRATPEGAAAGYRAVLDQARAAADELPALIVIPESAFPVYWQQSVALRQDLAAVAHGGSRILFNDVEEEADGRYFNAARLLGPEGLSGPSYRKVHLVPFGEYVPLPRLFFFVRQISTEIGAFTPAPRAELLRSGALAIGTAICYETIYPSLAREETPRGREPPRDDLERLVVRPRRGAGAALRGRRAAHGRERALARARGDHRDLRHRRRAGADPRRDAAGRAHARARRRAARGRGDGVDALGLAPRRRRRLGRRGRATLRPRPLGPRAPSRGSRSRAPETMTERDDLIAALSAASDRLAALRGYL